MYICIYIYIYKYKSENPLMSTGGFLMANQGVTGQNNYRGFFVEGIFFTFPGIRHVRNGLREGSCIDY